VFVQSREQTKCGANYMRSHQHIVSRPNGEQKYPQVTYISTTPSQTNVRVHRKYVRRPTNNENPLLPDESKSACCVHMMSEGFSNCLSLFVAPWTPFLFSSLHFLKWSISGSNCSSGLPLTLIRLFPHLQWVTAVAVFYNKQKTCKCSLEQTNTL